MPETLVAGDTIVPVSPKAHETPQDPLSHEVAKLIQLIRSETKHCRKSGITGELARFERAAQPLSSGGNVSPEVQARLRSAAERVKAQVYNAGRHGARGVVGKVTRLTTEIAKLTAQG